MPTRTFVVSPVERATKALPEVDPKTAVVCQIAGRMPPGQEGHEADNPPSARSRIPRRRVPDPQLPAAIRERRERRAREYEDRERRFWEKVAPAPIESCSRYHGTLLADVAFHPVVAAVHLAFHTHRPLRLSPDAIWLLLCQAVAHHVNANSETLRDRFVRHPGKARISVRRDDFLKGSPENPWSEVLDEFSTQVRAHVGPVIERFLPAFSTTGAAERAAAQIVLLDAMQSYFEYEFHTLCGIPEITLEGTSDDWDELAARAETFADLGLETWITVLRPVLAQFGRAARGEVDPEFWGSLYKFEGGSGGPHVNGWIAAFFPYLMDHSSGTASWQVDWIDDPSLLEPGLFPPSTHRKFFGHGPTLEEFPSGLSRAPFSWKHRRSTVPMEFLAGFLGVSQDPDTLALRPEIGWAVREAPPPSA